VTLNFLCAMMCTTADSVEFEVAGIRIGTLRTYPVVKSRENQDGREIKKTFPFYLSVKGIKFSVALKGNYFRTTCIKLSYCKRANDIQ